MDRLLEWLFETASLYVSWWNKHYYRCARCMRLYRKRRSDAEAMKEAEANGFVEEGMQLVMVCDDCYKLVMKQEEGTR